MRSERRRTRQRPDQLPGSTGELERAGKQWLDAALVALRKYSRLSQSAAVATGLLGFLILFAGSQLGEQFIVGAGIAVVGVAFLGLIAYSVLILQLEYLPDVASSLWQSISTLVGFRLSGGLRHLRPSILLEDGTVPTLMERRVRRFSLSETERDSFDSLTEEWNGSADELAAAVRLL